MKISKSTILKSGLLFLVATFAMPGAASAQQSVKIGLLMTYTGQFTDAATQMDNGIKLYMKEHGDAIAGRKIEIIRKDDAGAPDQAKRLAQELIVNDHVDIFGGFVITPEALAIADMLTESKKLAVLMNAATSIITAKSPYFTRVSLTLPQNCEALGTWAAQSGVKKAFTLVSDYAPGLDAERAFQRAYSAAGGQIIGSVRAPMANPDFSAFVQRAKDSGADGIFVFVPGGSQPVAIAKATIERGMDPAQVTIMGQGELADESALKAMGDAAIGIITAFHCDYNHDSETNKHFVAAYNAEFKRNPDFFSLGGYDGMHLIYAALKKTNGAADGDSLIAAVKGMRWESPRGPIAIDPETRDVINTVYIRRVEKLDGKIRNVEFTKFDDVKDPVKARMK